MLQAIKRVWLVGKLVVSNRDHPSWSHCKMMHCIFLVSPLPCVQHFLIQRSTSFLCKNKSANAFFIEKKLCHWTANTRICRFGHPKCELWTDLSHCQHHCNYNFDSIIILLWSSTPKSRRGIGTRHRSNVNKITSIEYFNPRRIQVKFSCIRQNFNCFGRRCCMLFSLPLSGDNQESMDKIRRHCIRQQPARFCSSGGLLNIRLHTGEEVSICKVLKWRAESWHHIDSCYEPLY